MSDYSKLVIITKVINRKKEKKKLSINKCPIEFLKSNKKMNKNKLLTEKMNKNSQREE